MMEWTGLYSIYLIILSRSIIDSKLAGTKESLGKSLWTILWKHDLIVYRVQKSKLDHEKKGEINTNWKGKPCVCAKLLGVFISWTFYNSGQGFSERTSVNKKGMEKGRKDGQGHKVTCLLSENKVFCIFILEMKSAPTWVTWMLWIVCTGNKFWGFLSYQN